MSISYFKVQYLHYLIAESMNVNILFYSPISTLSDSRVNECTVLYLACGKQNSDNVEIQLQNKTLTFIDSAIRQCGDSTTK
jgi:hypothetical protein